jgi:DNA-binding GntR family transcriptional regulator
MTETTNESFRNYSRPSDDMHHHTTLVQLQECRDRNDVKKILEEPLQELIQNAPQDT